MNLAANAPIVDDKGRPTRTFLSFINGISSDSSGSLEAQVVALSARVTQAEVDIAALEGAVVSHTADIADLDNRTEALEVLSLRAPIWP